MHIIKVNGNEAFLKASVKCIFKMEAIIKARLIWEFLPEKMGFSFILMVHSREAMLNKVVCKVKEYLSQNKGILDMKGIGLKINQMVKEFNIMPMGQNTKEIL